jgi:hypothetical protein
VVWQHKLVLELALVGEDGDETGLAAVVEVVAGDIELA